MNGETRGFDPGMDRELKLEAKMAGIKGNPGEKRTDEEIRRQAEEELEAEE